MFTRISFITARVGIFLVWGTVAQGTVVMDTVPVGNPGNAADTRYASPGYGAVSYTYQMGKFEVTAGQYCEFLNAVAKTDTYGLYNIYMWEVNVYGLDYGCKIQRSGSSGNYTYSVADDRANRPVNWVGWGDAARFANWLTNGQPTGEQNPSTTEDGSYYLNGATTAADLVAVTRKGNARYVIPSEDEWYKAAFHKNDGVTGSYFVYPTSSDSVPSNVLGNPTDPGNNATYYNSHTDFTIGYPYWRTEVGAHENSDSPYGTFDQGGNVYEWNEAAYSPGLERCRRGGSWDTSWDSPLRAEYRNLVSTLKEDSDLGFRVAEVTEPATLGLLALGGLGILRRRRPPRHIATSNRGCHKSGG